MKKWNLLLVLVLSLGLTMTFVACDDDDDDDGPTGPSNPTPEEMVVGTWLSAGADVAPILQEDPSNLDSVYAIFDADGSVTLEQHVEGGSWSTNTGTWNIEESADSDIHVFSATYNNPSYSQEGIIEFFDDGDSFRLEVLITGAGFTIPTPEMGFGATIFQDTNIQVYRMQ